MILSLTVLDCRFMKDNPIGAKPLSATGTDLHREWFGMHIKAIKAKWDSLSPEEKEVCPFLS